ncbi:MAG: nuclear transport factor 2 family protein [Actinomycetota bacterium]
MTYTRVDETFGKDAANRLDEATRPGIAGALAALESFYFAFNNGDLGVFRQVWVAHELIRLKNPLGGILEGIHPITDLYAGIFNGPADVWVEFTEIVAYELGQDAAVFSGRERGEFTRAGVTVDLDIRTTRVFHRINGRWGQIHHHGSITDAEQLNTYRSAVQS